MEIVLENNSLKSDKKETSIPIANSEIRRLSHYQRKPLFGFKISITLTVSVIAVGLILIYSDKKENKTTSSNSSISTAEPFELWDKSEQSDKQRIVKNSLND